MFTQEQEESATELSRILRTHGVSGWLYRDRLRKNRSAKPNFIATTNLAVRPIEFVSQLLDERIIRRNLSSGHGVIIALSWN
jgi:hypothetical protein